MADRSELVRILLSRLRPRVGVVIQLCPTCDDMVEAELTTDRRGARITDMTSRCPRCAEIIWRRLS